MGRRRAAGGETPAGFLPETSHQGRATAACVSGPVAMADVTSATKTLLELDRPSLAVSAPASLPCVPKRNWGVDRRLAGSPCGENRDRQVEEDEESCEVGAGGKPCGDLFKPPRCGARCRKRPRRSPSTAPRTVKGRVTPSGQLKAAVNCSSMIVPSEPPRPATVIEPGASYLLDGIYEGGIGPGQWATSGVRTTLEEARRRAAREAAPRQPAARNPERSGPSTRQYIGMPPVIGITAPDM